MTAARGRRRRTSASPFDVRRYAFVDLDRDGHVISTVTSGPDDDPDPLPDVAGLKAPAGPVTVASVGGDPQYRVVTHLPGRRRARWPPASP